MNLRKLNIGKQKKRRFESRFEQRFSFKSDTDPNIVLKGDYRVVPVTIPEKDDTPKQKGYLVVFRKGADYEVFVILPIETPKGDEKHTDDINAALNKITGKANPTEGTAAFYKKELILIAQKIYPGKTFVIYEDVFDGKETDLSSPNLYYANTYDYINSEHDDSDRYNNIPYHTKEDGKHKTKIPKTSQELIQGYTDTYEEPLPGDDKRRETTDERTVRLKNEADKKAADDLAEAERKQKAEAERKRQEDRAALLVSFQNEKLAEYVCLIVIGLEKDGDPKTKLPHLFVYWTGNANISPESPDQNFYPDTISYYYIDLNDVQYKNDHITVYNQLVQGLSKGSNQGGMDPLGSSLYKQAFFDLKPVNPPSDLATYTEEELKHLPIDPNSLMGWFMSLPESNAGLNIMDDSGNVPAQYNYREFAGNKQKVANPGNLFSHKVHPPEDIVTAFKLGYSYFNIPADFADENSVDAKAVNFTLKEFNDNVAYLIRYLRAFPTMVKIKISGHTDSAGDPAKNLKLSRKRAYSFYKYLQTASGLGIAPLTKAEAERQIGPDAAFNENSDLGDYVVGKGEEICLAEKGDEVSDPHYRKIKIAYESV